MERDVSIELLEERDPLTDHDRQDRIIDLVGQPEAKTFARDRAPADEPDGAKRRPQALVYELRQIAGIELDGIPRPRQIPGGEHKGGLVAIRPAVSLSFEAQRGLVGARAHDV